MADTTGSAGNKERHVSGSVVWHYFFKDATGGVCNTCKKHIPTKRGNTSGMIRHLALQKFPHQEYMDKKTANRSSYAEQV